MGGEGVCLRGGCAQVSCACDAAMMLAGALPRHNINFIVLQADERRDKCWRALRATSELV